MLNNSYVLLVLCHGYILNDYICACIFYVHMYYIYSYNFTHLFIQRNDQTLKTIILLQTKCLRFIKVISKRYQKYFVFFHRTQFCHNQQMNLAQVLLFFFPTVNIFFLLINFSLLIKKSISFTFIKTLRLPSHTVFSHPAECPNCHPFRFCVQKLYRSIENTQKSIKLRSLKEQSFHSTINPAVHL